MKKSLAVSVVLGLIAMLGMFARSVSAYMLPPEIDNGSGVYGGYNPYDPYGGVCGGNPLSSGLYGLGGLSVYGGNLFGSGFYGLGGLSMYGYMYDLAVPSVKDGNPLPPVMPPVYTGIFSGGYNKVSPKPEPPRVYNANPFGGYNQATPVPEPPDTPVYSGNLFGSSLLEFNPQPEPPRVFGGIFFGGYNQATPMPQPPPVYGLEVFGGFGN